MTFDSLGLVHVVVGSAALDVQVRHDGGREEAPVRRVVELRQLAIVNLVGLAKKLLVDNT